MPRLNDKHDGIAILVYYIALVNYFPNKKGKRLPHTKVEYMQFTDVEHGFVVKQHGCCKQETSPIRGVKKVL